MRANAMDQAGYPGVSLEQKWKGEWEMFGGLSRVGKGLLGVRCWFMLVLTCVLTGLGVGPLVGRALGRGG